MKDLMMINPTGVTRLFRFVTPAALTLLTAAGWEPVRRSLSEVAPAASGHQAGEHAFLD